MNKKFLSVLIVDAIILLAYLIIFLVIPFPKNTVSWMSFVFSVISIIGGCAITYYAFAKGDTLKSKVYGYPVLRIGIIYTAVQMIAGLLFCIVGIFVDIPVWIPAVVYVLILAAGLIGVIATDNIRDVVAQHDEDIAASVRMMNSFKVDIQYIVDCCTDPVLKKEVEKLSESFRYSDPVSCDELYQVEAQLRDEVNNLAALVYNNPQAARDKTFQIGVLLADRNRRCKELKK